MRVGLLDTGIDRADPALAGARVIERDFVGEPDGEPADRAHGSRSARLLVAGRSGITLLVARVIRPGGGAPVAGVAAGLDWLVAEGAAVVAMPLGSEADDAAVAAAVDRALAAGVICVAATGSGAVLFPARHPGVIAVAGDGGLSSSSRCAAAAAAMVTASSEKEHVLD